MKAGCLRPPAACRDRTCSAALPTGFRSDARPAPSTNAAGDSSGRGAPDRTGTARTRPTRERFSLRQMLQRVATWPGRTPRRGNDLRREDAWVLLGKSAFGEVD